MSNTGIELLAPAGNLEKLKFACRYGADAVYCGGRNFGLRAYGGNFDDDELAAGTAFAHSLNKRVYVTVNAFPRDSEFADLEKYIGLLKKIKVDAVIAADAGVFACIRKNAPDLPVHISTQANTVNSGAAEFWHQNGASRIVLARELSMNEVKEICSLTKAEIEVFVHGAMCISYSGRCLLSNYFTGRDSNRGGCTQPCRWKYHIVEETRPGQFFPVMEDRRGTYIFNSRDLCMINYIPELIESGVCSLKIEGRMKSAYYTATVTNAYRRAIDAYYCGTLDEKLLDGLRAELAAVSHREYCNGFYFGNSSADGQIYDNSSYRQTHEFVGIVRRYDRERGVALIEQRNNIKSGEKVEIFQPDLSSFEQIIGSMRDSEGNNISVAPHPQQLFEMAVDYPVEEMAILRRVADYAVR